jgi:cytochrome c oxidase subunit 2
LNDRSASVHKFWAILFGAVLAGCALLFVVAPIMGWWLPENHASFGGSTDGLFYLILVITGITYIGVEVVFVWALWRFNARPGAKSEYTHGNHKLEMIWTAVPSVILLFIAFTQVKAWADIKYQSRMPDPDQVFEVSARQFEWRFRYPVAEQLYKMTTDWKSTGQRVSAEWDKKPQADDVHVVNEVHTWKGAKVRMYLKTRDVLHSFFLPNLRIKQDALPGKTIPVWYDADETNCKYDEATNSWQFIEGKAWELACAELCGWGHYKMRGHLYVHENKEDYLRWLSHAADKQNTRKRE